MLYLLFQPLFRAFQKLGQKKCKKFHWSFGVWEDKIICFWDLLTFILIQKTSQNKLYNFQLRVKKFITQPFHLVAGALVAFKVDIIAQSICTHYSCFENKGRFACKCRVQKTGWFLHSIFWTWCFLKFQTWSSRIVGAGWLGEYAPFQSTYQKLF